MPILDALSFACGTIAAIGTSLICVAIWISHRRDKFFRQHGRPTGAARIIRDEVEYQLPNGATRWISRLAIVVLVAALAAGCSQARADWWKLPCPGGAHFDCQGDSCVQACNPTISVDAGDGVAYYRADNLIPYPSVSLGDYVAHFTPALILLDKSEGEYFRVFMHDNAVRPDDMAQACREFLAKRSKKGRR